jgi:hypothetical protein
MGRWKRDGNYSPPKNNLIQDSQGNKENEYPVPDSNKKKDKQCQGTPKNPKEYHKIRNTASNYWEFHEDVTRHGQTKQTRAIQKIPKHKKWRIWEDTETNKWTQEP